VSRPNRLRPTPPTPPHPPCQQANTQLAVQTARSILMLHLSRYSAHFSHIRPPHLAPLPSSNCMKTGAAAAIVRPFTCVSLLSTDSVVLQYLRLRQHAVLSACAPSARSAFSVRSVTTQCFLRALRHHAVLSACAPSPRSAFCVRSVTTQCFLRALRHYAMRCVNTVL
jgi:hypothetical protein